MEITEADRTDKRQLAPRPPALAGPSCGKATLCHLDPALLKHPIRRLYTRNRLSILRSADSASARLRRQLPHDTPDPASYSVAEAIGGRSRRQARHSRIARVASGWMAARIRISVELATVAHGVKDFYELPVDLIHRPRRPL